MVYVRYIQFKKEILTLIVSHTQTFCSCTAGGIKLEQKKSFSLYYYERTREK
jgi:hypothetical protein